MKTPLAWMYDVTEIMSIREVIVLAYLRNPSAVSNTKALRDARDRLAVIIDQMAQSGMGAENEDAYLHLFDALSYLTDALRSPVVRMSSFNRALQELDEVFTIDMDV